MESLDRARPRHHRRLIACLGLLLAGGPHPAAGSTAAGHPAEPAAPADSLRREFHGAGTSTRVVGRLGVDVWSDSSYRPVRLDHVFSSGDRFRIEVAANRDGWLFLLHRELGDEDWQVLWPQGEQGRRGWKVRASRAYRIPPEPGSFVFDEAVAVEVFYVALCRRPELPPLESLATERPSREAASESGGQRDRRREAVNFGIRGVFFDPGPEEDDAAGYFATPGPGSGDLAVLEFRLLHRGTGE